jgi:proton glutamate symport protein
MADEVQPATRKLPLLVPGLLLYALGVAEPFLFHMPAAIGTALRVAGVAILFWYALRQRALSQWILWSMLAGVELGLDAPALALHLKVFSDIFLRLIRTIVAPLILGTLICGIAAHGSSRDVGRIGLKALVYFEISTTIALAVGLVAINISHAGAGLAGKLSVVAAAAPAATQMQTWDQFLLHIVPENLAKAVAENQLLQVAVFAVIFGLAMGRLTEAARRPLLDVIESLTKTMFQFTNLVMYLAPLAVGAALAFTVAQAGIGSMVSLGKLLLTLYVALGAFIVVGLLPAAWIARVPIRRFVVAVAEPATIAFATSTSEAALPLALERMEELGVPARIVGFVLPTGYSFNLTGSALYLSLASVFVAQAGGIHMGWGRQLAMMATLMLTSKGVAGVPRAGIVVLMATASSFDLPLEPIALLLGIDALMDMGRTSINVVGNCLASVVVAKWEGEFGLAVRADAPLVPPDAR